MTRTSLSPTNKQTNLKIPIIFRLLIRSTQRLENYSNYPNFKAIEVKLKPTTIPLDPEISEKVKFRRVNLESEVLEFYYVGLNYPEQGDNCSTGLLIMGLMDGLILQ